MADRMVELATYIDDIKAISELADKILEIDTRIEQIDDIVEATSEDGLNDLDGLFKEAHMLRIERFELALEQNSLERRTLQFQLEEELRD